MSETGGESPCFAHLVTDHRDVRAVGAGEPVVVDLSAGTTAAGEADGAVWNLRHGGDLDANLVRLGAGRRIGEHVNDEVDVLVLVQAGSGQIGLGDRLADVAPGHLALIPRGAGRSVTAGPEGLDYLTVHRRRGPLQIADKPGVAS